VTALFQALKAGPLRGAFGSLDRLKPAGPWLAMPEWRGPPFRHVRFHLELSRIRVQTFVMSYKPSDEETSAYDQMIERLKAASISTKELEVSQFVGRRVKIDFPNGPRTREIFKSEMSAPSFSKAAFEQIKFLGDFEAIHDSSTNEIEALVAGLDNRSQFILQSLFKSDDEDEEQDEEADTARDTSVEQSETKAVKDRADDGQMFVEHDGGISISLVRTSERIRSITRGLSKYALRISSVHSERHDEVLRQLTTLSNSYFFALNLEHGLSLQLTRQRRGARRRLPSVEKVRKAQPVFPSHEYDADPISLYWYAQSAKEMPLLEFLSLYQVLEHYFPFYVNKKASGRIRTILKHPTFRVDRDEDVAKIVSIIDNRSRGAFWSERQQLKAVVEGCVTEEELTEFVTASKTRADFFSKVHKQLTSEKVLSGSPPNVSAEAVAKALYDIRCKIVHSKLEDGELGSGRLLPFSEDVELLSEFTSLIEFLAQRVLISTSSKLEL